jgi:hypothetical protein
VVRSVNSSETKTVLAAWLVVVTIAAAAFIALSALSRDVVVPDVLRPAGHWSVPRVTNGDLLDEGAAAIFWKAPWFEPVNPLSPAA